MESGKEYTVNLPIAFASACYVAFTQSAQTESNNSYNNSCLVWSKTTTTLKLIKDESTCNMYWMAIGK